MLQKLAALLKISPAPKKDLPVSADTVIQTGTIIQAAVAAGLAPALADALLEQAAELDGNTALDQYFKTIAPVVFNQTLSTENLDLIPETIGSLLRNSRSSISGWTIPHSTQALRNVSATMRNSLRIITSFPM